MKTFTLALALLAVGCNGSDPGTSSQETDPRDTGGDTDPVTDTDTAADTDTSADTDTAEEPDTSPVSVTCGPEDLVFRVEARDANGALAETFQATDMPMLVGLVENPCDDGHVALETESTCLVDLWTITGPEGDPLEIRPVCEATPTAWSVRPSDTEEATYKMTMVVPGEYEVETHFTYNAESATTKFTVAEPTLPE